MSDVIPMALLAGCERVEKVRITEILNYVEYYGAGEARSLRHRRARWRRLLATRNGSPQEHRAILASAIRHLGRSPRRRVDEIRTGLNEVAPALQRTEVEGCVIEPGTFGALRHTTQGCVEGRPVIEFAFVTRYDNTAAPIGLPHEADTEAAIGSRWRVHSPSTATSIWSVIAPLPSRPWVMPPAAPNSVRT